MDTTNPDVSDLTEEELESAMQSLENIAELDKPLTASERKVLRDVVNGDFDRLLAETQLRARIERDRQVEEYEKKIEEYRQEARDIAAEMNAIFDKAVEQVQAKIVSDRRDGAPFTLHAPREVRVEVTIADKWTVLNRISDSYKTAVYKAEKALAAKRALLLRQIDLAGVTPAARVLLDAIPTADEAVGLLSNPVAIEPVAIEEAHDD